MTQKALRFALEALDNLMYWDNGKSEYDEARDAIIAIKQALAQHDSVQAKPEPEHEPVAFKCGDAIVHIKPPVYGATPPQRTWVGLTDEQRMEMWRTTKFRGNGGQVDWFIEGTRAAETALREALAEQKSGIKQVIELYDSPDQPAQRTWQGLTHEQVDSWELPDCPTVFEFAQFIEAKLKERNS